MLAGIGCCNAFGQPFTDVTAESGLIHTHSNASQQGREAILIAGGGTVGDFDHDGDPDVYLVGGGENTNVLFRNNGDGSFADITAGSGTGLNDILGSGPLFVDVDGDRDLDLLVFSVHQWDQPIGSDPDLLENRARLLINNGSGVYTESPDTSGFDSGMPNFGGTMGDLDLDGDLDLFMVHWNSSSDGFQLFWENDGAGHFTDVTNDYLGTQINTLDRFSFTANITDINEDGWPDVLLASDFGTSRMFMSDGINAGQLTFTVEKPPVLTDENGMGAAVGDYDNDGDLDWFVSSIWDPDFEAEGNWGISGNRLYRNTGNGVFEDVTTEAGVRRGYWGWGSCFADFNNDTYLDIYHENGFSIGQAEEFFEDPSRLFMSNGDGSFTESAVSNGLTYTGQGRGISCFDYDLDGDLDILVMPNGSEVHLYRNDLPKTFNYLKVLLTDGAPNPHAIGASIELVNATVQQYREVTAGSNYVSNNETQQHFGLHGAGFPQQVNIIWPDGESKLVPGPIAINQTLSIGRYCHTTYITSIITDQPANLMLQANMPDGTPINATEIELQILSGPHTGQNQTATTDTQGQAMFVLNNSGSGQDQLRYQFEAAGDTRECLALLNWEPQETLLTNGFEAPLVSE